MSLLPEIQKKKLKTQTESQTKSLFNDKDASTQKYETNVYAVGYGNYGRLGQGNELSSSKFISVKSISPKLIFTQLCGGAAHILAITDKQELYSWGKCNYGQLGHGQEDEDRYLPTKVEFFSQISICKVSAGDAFSFAISDEGKIYCWGCGFYGALGLGEEKSIYLPQEMTTFPKNTSKIVELDGGSFHSVALFSDGSIYVWGKNESGQCGTGDKLNKRVPTLLSNPFQTKSIACGQNHTLFLSNEGKVFGCGSNQGFVLEQPENQIFTFIVELPEKNITQISAGLERSLLLQNSDTIILLDTKRIEYKMKSTIVAIDSGENHYACISESGKLFTWGNTISGKLGQYSDSSKPTKISSLPGKVKSIYCGSNHTLVLLSND